MKSIKKTIYKSVPLNYNLKMILSVFNNFILNLILSMYKGILTIPNNVTIIKSEEYSDNLEINELRFEEPSNLKKIEDRSFANCLNLHTIQSIPPSVTVLENGAFLGCSGLLKVTLAQRHVQDELTFIDKNNFTIS